MGDGDGRVIIVSERASGCVCVWIVLRCCRKWRGGDCTSRWRESEWTELRYVHHLRLLVLTQKREHHRRLNSQILHFPPLIIIIGVSVQAFVFREKVQHLLLLPSTFIHKTRRKMERNLSEDDFRNRNRPRTHIQYIGDKL